MRPKRFRADSSNHRAVIRKRRKRNQKPHAVTFLPQLDVVTRSGSYLERVHIQSSEEAITLLRGVFDSEKIEYKEMFYVLLLNRANLCIGYSHIATGSDVGVVVHMKEILHLALLTNAQGVILAHNHPSGSLKVSDADVILTKKVCEGCRLFDTKLLDHLILTSNGHVSLADEGLF